MSPASASTAVSLARWLVLDRAESDSPGAKAGLKAGDVVLRVGEVRVACALDLERGLLDHAAGEKLPVLIRRKGTEQRLEIVLQSVERPAPTANDLIWRKLGLRLNPVNAELVARKNRPLHGGMEVVQINEEGCAAKAGIQRGDIVVGLHNWETVSHDNVHFVLTHPELASFNPLRFYIVRAGELHRGWIQQVE